jgi:vacuolar-type H+-ATPase subunit I/STV1
MITMINCRTAPTQAGAYVSTHWHTNNNATKTSAFLSSIGKTSSWKNSSCTQKCHYITSILHIVRCLGYYVKSNMFFDAFLQKSTIFLTAIIIKCSLDLKLNLARLPSTAEHISDIISLIFILRLSLIHWSISWTIRMLAIRNISPSSFQFFHQLVNFTLVPILLAMSNSHTASQFTPSNNTIRITNNFYYSMRKIYEMYS